jgi:hypothetical protein
MVPELTEDSLMELDLREKGLARAEFALLLQLQLNSATQMSG